MALLCLPGGVALVDHGFAAHTQAAMSAEGVGMKNVSAWAGAAMLVTTRVKSRAHAYICHAGGQAVLVWAAGLLLCSCYAAQNEHMFTRFLAS